MSKTDGVPLSCEAVFRGRGVPESLDFFPEDSGSSGATSWFSDGLREEPDDLREESGDLREEPPDCGGSERS
ncbi:MAG: hypothetical protein LBQ50_05815, partial [Planctomycetaceae bacterium]|nr:hypothetical protein [Planctomycetaceae bacterium]